MCKRNKPIVVHASVWGMTKWFRHNGNTHRVKLLSQARSYLERYGRTLIGKFS